MKAKGRTGIPTETLKKLTLELEKMTPLDHALFVKKLDEPPLKDFIEWTKKRTPICLNKLKK